MEYLIVGSKTRHLSTSGRTQRRSRVRTARADERGGTLSATLQESGQ